jgi:hypothetical protein
MVVLAEPLPRLVVWVKDKIHVLGEVLQLCFKCYEPLFQGVERVVWLPVYRHGGAGIIQPIKRHGPFV